MRFIKGSAHIQKYQSNGSSNYKRLIFSSTQSQKFWNFFTHKFWKFRSAMFARLVFLNVLLLIGSHAVHSHWWWLVGEDSWVDYRQPKVKSNLCQSCQMELLKLGSLKISRSQRGVLSWTYLLSNIWNIDFIISYVNEILNVFSLHLSL